MPQIIWRPVICGALFQFLFGIFCIRMEIGRNIFNCVGNKTATFLSYTTSGSTLVFGESLGKNVFAFSVSFASVLFLRSSWIYFLKPVFEGKTRCCRWYSSSVSLFRCFTIGMWCNGLFKNWVGFCSPSWAQRFVKALSLEQIFFLEWLKRRYWFDPISQ